MNTAMAITPKNTDGKGKVTNASCSPSAAEVRIAFIISPKN
jgi:hypothetical protein